jgi:hypothetical protein
MSFLKKSIVGLILVGAGLTTSLTASPADSLFNYVYRTFSFLPRYYTEADLFAFFLQKNDYFRKRYYLESNTDLGFVFLSYKNLINSVWDFEFQIGLGQTPGNVVFDPMDINFGLTPAIEVRMLPVVLATGLEHRCYHEIDRKDFATVYLNKFFIAAGSLNYRLYDYWEGLCKENTWALVDRLSWYTRAGYYVREFFGVVDPGKINGENNCLYEVAANVRYAFYQRKSWIVNLRTSGRLGAAYDSVGTTDKMAYWRFDLGLESNFKYGYRGGMMFINYSLDHLPLYNGLPRFSKDQLLQIGVRFY